MTAVPFSRSTRLLIGTLVATVALLTIATPAQAAPGDASATPVASDLVITPADTGTPGAVMTSLGAVTAPPSDSTSFPAATIQADLGPNLGGVQDVLFFDDLAASASSDASGVEASASVGSMRLETPAGSLVISGVSSGVQCSVGGGLAASANGPSQVLLADSPVLLDPSGTTVIDLSSGLGTFVLTVTTGGTTYGDHSAAATGLTIEVTEDLTDLLTANGTITLAQSRCESLPTTITSGVIRAAENGAPLQDVCIVWSPASDPGNNTVLSSNGNGTFSIETEQIDPINIGFFVPENQYDCFGSIDTDRVPSWFDGEALSAATGLDAVAPVAALAVTPGTSGIVACLGTSMPVASTDCVVPDVVLSGWVVGVSGAPEQACIFVLGGEGIAIGPFVTASDGTWTGPDLPRDVDFVVAFLPYYEGDDGLCVRRPAACAGTGRTAAGLLREHLDQLHRRIAVRRSTRLGH